MKKIIYSSFTLLAALIFSGCEHNLVIPEAVIKPIEFLADTAPMKRMVVLEEISGVLCWWTPTGHTMSKAIRDANPERVILVSIHASTFAAGPGTGWPNYTSKPGKAIYEQAMGPGIPSATVNRMKCSELGVSSMGNNPYAIDRYYWGSAVKTAMTISAPVNVGARATFDTLTRILTVKVDLYYTANETLPNNINICLLQDKIVGWQTTGLRNQNIPDYIQNNVFRDMITPGNWGETISGATIRGTKITRVYQYTVPHYYNGNGPDSGGAVVQENLKVVAFVSRGQLEILNAAEVKVK